MIDLTLDGRKEIANYNRFMDQIFIRMNLAIKVRNAVDRVWHAAKKNDALACQLKMSIKVHLFQAKRLDPVDLKIMSTLAANAPKVKIPRFDR